MVRASAARTWTGAALVAALAVVVAVLAVIAMQRVATAPAANPEGSARPVPTVEPSQSALPTPIAPTASSPTVPPAVPRADERYLAAGAGGVIWRGTAGSCEEEIAPVLERSTDDGSTWVDVTPTYRGITELVSVDDFAQGQADLIASVLDDGSDGDPCDVRALRTFSDGAFWDDYDDVLAASSYAAPNDAATIVTPDGPVEAPCAEPRSVRSGGGRLALVCDGSAFEWDGAQWTDREMPAAVAVAVTEAALYVAHLADDCPGVQLSAVTGEEPASLACQQGVDPRHPLAMDVTDAIRIWTGDELLATPLPEGAAG